MRLQKLSEALRTLGGAARAGRRAAASVARDFIHEAVLASEKAAQSRLNSLYD